MKNPILKLITKTNLIVATIAFSSSLAHGDMERTFIDLGKKANPAVVNIFTTQVIKNPYGRRGAPMMPMDPFQDFMEQFMGGGPLGGAPREQKASSLGSGFIIEESGLIVTNNHVIQNASDIQVQLTEKSKKTYKAKVVGKDERSDIAIIKINFSGKLSILALGDSDKVEVGQWVAAFGNPLGHGHTMTKGIISAKERDVDVENAPQFPFLQTDASINPGNSGGPLVNLNGEVIGVNAAIDIRGQGIGFAIPINAVKKILPDLKSKGKVTRGFLGVGITDVNDQIAKEFGLKSDKGAFVTGVTPGSPAEQSGLQTYDIITHFGGKEVESARSLMNFVADAKIGEQVTTDIVRSGKAMKLKIKISEKNDGLTAKNQPQRQSRPQGQKAPHGFGLELADLNSFSAREFGIPPFVKKGVVIVGVEEGSLAEQAGLNPGDVILDVNRTPVSTTSQALQAFQKDFKKGSSGVKSLRIQRGPNTMVVFVELE